MVLSVLKALWESNIDSDVINATHLTNLLLIECEKHQNDDDWAPEVIGDRLIGILLQVVNLFQNYIMLRYSAYIVPTVEKMRTLYAGKCGHVQG